MTAFQITLLDPKLGSQQISWKARDRGRWARIHASTPRLKWDQGGGNPKNERMEASFPDSNMFSKLFPWARTLRARSRTPRALAHMSNNWRDLIPSVIVHKLLFCYWEIN